MKKIVGAIVLGLFVLGTTGMALAETKKERWIREQDHKIDQEAKKKKEDAHDSNSSSAYKGGAAKQQKRESQIDGEAAEKKKQVREAAKGLGSKGDETYDPKKDKRTNKPNI